MALSKSGPNSGHMFRCKQMPDNISSMFWRCPILKEFWLKIFGTFSSIYNKDIEPGPLTATVGVALGETQLTSTQGKAIAFTSLLARRLILFNWIKATLPSHEQWVEEVMAHLKLEHLRFILQGNTKRYFKVWQPFISYFEHEFSSVPT